LLNPPTNPEPKSGIDRCGITTESSHSLARVSTRVW
jgi:hypothetical protein